MLRNMTWHKKPRQVPVGSLCEVEPVDHKRLLPLSKFAQEKLQESEEKVLKDFHFLTERLGHLSSLFVVFMKYRLYVQGLLFPA